MKRWHEEYVIAKRQQHRFNNWRGRLSLWRFVEAGRFRKRHAFDCGIVQCKICHWHKYPKREPSRAERQNRLSFVEQLRERLSP
jgi:hypothetical protein